MYATFIYMYLGSFVLWLTCPFPGWSNRKGTLNLVAITRGKRSSRNARCDIIRIWPPTTFSSASRFGSPHFSVPYTKTKCSSALQLCNGKITGSWATHLKTLLLAHATLIEFISVFGVVPQMTSVRQVAVISWLTRWLTVFSLTQLSRCPVVTPNFDLGSPARANVTHINDTSSVMSFAVLDSPKV